MKAHDFEHFDGYSRCRACGLEVESGHFDPHPCYPLEPGWIAAQLEQAQADAQEWPEWMRRAAGLPPGQTKAQMAARIAELEAALERHRGFFADMWACRYDLEDVQESAVKHGLATRETVTQSCGEDCDCVAHGFPGVCVRRKEGA